MQMIHKYPCPIKDDFTLPMPATAQVLDVQISNPGSAFMWVKLDPALPNVDRHFVLFGTGSPIPDISGKYLYVGTFQDRIWVWHLFEVVF